MSRLHNRAPTALRPVTIERGCAKHAEGSALVRFGDTHVLCAVSVLEGVPRFLRGKNQGWLTAEYGMLPRSTGTRMEREATRGKQGGRTLEIQRLIGRSLRAALDMSRLGEITLQVDCDVLQADGGTRTASVTGACVALVDALRRLQRQRALKTDPLTGLVAAVSVGMVAGEARLDLDYAEDSTADTDLNLVMLEGKGLIEVQGTAEGRPFSEAELAAMVALGRAGIEQLFEAQRAALVDA